MCLACGETLPPRHRRYCSMVCKQQLLASLNRRAGLLRALNIRYATFYFTQFVIIMDMLPYDCDQIHSYMLVRKPGSKPVEDFCELSNTLGTVWWNEKNRTKKRYLASQFLLDQATKPDAPVERVIPTELVIPAVSNSNLISLDLKVAQMTSSRLESLIKQAYRRQAKKHHPDIGGNAQTFVRIKDAYEKLIKWARHPTYARKRGFPDKWLYEGAYDRWIQPIIFRKARRAK
jgi:hypothetical protein